MPTTILLPASASALYTMVHQCSITRCTQQYMIVQATRGCNPTLHPSFTSIVQDLKKPCTKHGATTHCPH